MPGVPHEPEHKEELTPEEKAALEHLREYPFLKPLSETVLGKLQPNLIERTYAAGDTMLRAGEYSDAAFYLKSGIVEIKFAASAGAPSIKAQTKGGEKKGAPRAVGGFAAHKAAVAADGTVIVSDMPVDLSLNKHVLLEP